MTVKALFVLVFSTVRTALRQTKIKTKTKTKNLRLGIHADCTKLKLKPYLLACSVGAIRPE